MLETNAGIHTCLALANPLPTAARPWRMRVSQFRSLSVPTAPKARANTASPCPLLLDSQGRCTLRPRSPTASHCAGCPGTIRGCSHAVSQAPSNRRLARIHAMPTNTAMHAVSRTPRERPPSAKTFSDLASVISRRSLFVSGSGVTIHRFGTRPSHAKCTETLNAKIAWPSQCIHSCALAKGVSGQPSNGPAES